MRTNRYSLACQIQTTLTSALIIHILEYQLPIKLILLEINFTITKLKHNQTKLEHDQTMQLSNTRTRLFKPELFTNSTVQQKQLKPCTENLNTDIVVLKIHLRLLFIIYIY